MGVELGNEISRYWFKSLTFGDQLPPTLPLGCDENFACSGLNAELSIELAENAESGSESTIFIILSGSQADGGVNVLEMMRGGFAVVVVVIAMNFSSHSGRRAMTMFIGSHWLLVVSNIIKPQRFSIKVRDPLANFTQSRYL